MPINIIELGSLAVAFIALIFSFISFRRSEQLNTQVALQTHLAEQKNAIKKIWHESKPVIVQMNQILSGGYSLTEIGKTLNSIESKSEYTEGRPLRHHFYDLHSACFDQLEDAITAPEQHREVQLIASLLNIVYEGDIQPLLSGKTPKNNFKTFDILHTKSGAKKYAVLSGISRKDRELLYKQIVNKATEAFCVYTIHKSKIDSWLSELEIVKMDNELDNFSINQNTKLQRRFNIMFNMLSFFQSRELEYLVKPYDTRDVDAGCILHGAVTLYLFGKLAEAYVQGDYQKIEQ
ncbi:hypothetical protein [uncultured Tolumonas sp.]|uniref:hypothetical protein n=1 Tax=uncultured Tolumonas sp. TaxID=263765 RepID=UPI00292EE298|nr:hypothetical protein [uncultured Tolumonas sp.]